MLVVSGARGASGMVSPILLFVSIGSSLTFASGGGVAGVSAILGIEVVTVSGVAGVLI